MALWDTVSKYILPMLRSTQVGVQTCEMDGLDQSLTLRSLEKVLKLFPEISFAHHSVQSTPPSYLSNYRVSSFSRALRIHRIFPQVGGITWPGAMFALTHTCMASRSRVRRDAGQHVCSSFAFKEWSIQRYAFSHASEIGCRFKANAISFSYQCCW